MAKLDIPKFRYLYQDLCGHVWCNTEKPHIADADEYWLGGLPYLYCYLDIKENTNWGNTLIDIETDDYEFEDGILRRIEK